MFDREYFDRVLNEQFMSIGQSVTVKIGLRGGRVLEVFQVFAAHASYVILAVHPPREASGWAPPLPPEERWTFDQVAVPYENIEWTELTTYEPEVDSKAPIGFQPPK